MLGIDTAGRSSSVALVDETQVLDIILVAAYRNFMSRVVNAAGLTLEGRLAELPAAFKDAIATGRPV